MWPPPDEVPPGREASGEVLVCAVPARGMVSRVWGDDWVASDDWPRALGPPAADPLATEIEVVRAIRTGQLHGLPHFHTRPVNVMVFHGPPRGELV